MCTLAQWQRYGDEKGACESIFSYGFLEDNTSSARVMFLDLDIPDDDPLRPAKMFVSTAAPGFRIFEREDTIDWESDYIWLVVINEEDGLDFKIRQTIDGKREIQAFWNAQELEDSSRLYEYLREDPAWDVFQLRATVLLQNRIDTQIETIQATQGFTQDLTIRDIPWRLAERLRGLELEMLEHATSVLDSRVRASVSLIPRISLEVFVISFSWCGSFVSECDPGLTVMCCGTNLRICAWSTDLYPPASSMQSMIHDMWHILILCPEIQTFEVEDCDAIPWYG
jgi:hypothetical protein